MSYDFLVASSILGGVRGKGLVLYECQTCFAVVRDPEKHWTARHRSPVDPENKNRPLSVEPVGGP